MANIATPPPLTVALLAVPAVLASTLYGFYDMLASVRRDWQRLHGGGDFASPFRPLVVSRDGLPLATCNGVRVTPDTSIADCPTPDVVCVTSLAIPPDSAPGEEYRIELQWLKDCHARGSVLASACTGAVLLASTGLLDGYEATSHWAYCDALAKRHPRTRWLADRGLVTAGAGGRILMSGTGMSWHMLALALIARFAGADEAMQVARINLLDTQRASPVAYASLTHGGPAADPVVAQCQIWAASNYALDAPAAQMVALSGLPERTFKRRFTQATGMSPLQYIHVVRLEEAKQMLEAGDEPVDSIAEAVGYQDPSFFNRLFRRRVSLTPSQYRRRFGTLGRQLRRQP